MINNNEQQKYRFSITAASLAVNEFLVLANHLVEVDFDFDQLSHQLMDKERSTTAKRKFSELILRIQELSQEEILFLTRTSLENKRLVIFLASVRLYRFLREFMEEVVIEKIKIFDYQLTNRDIVSFMYDKSTLYDEIRDLSDTTQKKVQQVIYKQLEQAGLIDRVATKKIRIPFIDYEMQNILSSIDKKYLLNL